MDKARHQRLLLRAKQAEAGVVSQKRRTPLALAGATKQRVAFPTRSASAPRPLAEQRLRDSPRVFETSTSLSSSRSGALALVAGYASSDTDDDLVQHDQQGQDASGASTGRNVRFADEDDDDDDDDGDDDAETMAQQSTPPVLPAGFFDAPEAGADEAGASAVAPVMLGTRDSVLPSDFFDTVTRENRVQMQVDAEEERLREEEIETEELAALHAEVEQLKHDQAAQALAQRHGPEERRNQLKRQLLQKKGLLADDTSPSRKRARRAEPTASARSGDDPVVKDDERAEVQGGDDEQQQQQQQQQPRRNDAGDDDYDRDGDDRADAESDETDETDETDSDEDEDDWRSKSVL